MPDARNAARSMMQLAVYKEPQVGCEQEPPVRLVVSGATKMWKLAQHINSALGASVTSAETESGAAYSRQHHDYRWQSGKSISGSAFLVQRPTQAGPAPGCAIIAGKRAAPHFWSLVSERCRAEVAAATDAAAAAAAAGSAGGGCGGGGGGAKRAAAAAAAAAAATASVAEQVLPDVHIDHHDVNVSALFRGVSTGAKLEQTEAEAAMAVFYFIKEHVNKDGAEVPTVGCQLVLEGIMPYAPPSQRCTRLRPHASIAVPRLVQHASRMEVAGAAAPSTAEKPWPHLKFSGTHTCKLNDAWRADRVKLEHLVSASSPNWDVALSNTELLDMAAPIFNVDGSDMPSTFTQATGACSCAACF